MSQFNKQRAKKVIESMFKQTYVTPEVRNDGVYIKCGQLNPQRVEKKIHDKFTDRGIVAKAAEKVLKTDWTIGEDFEIERVVEDGNTRLRMYGL